MVLRPGKFKDGKHQPWWLPRAGRGRGELVFSELLVQQDEEPCGPLACNSLNVLKGPGRTRLEVTEPEKKCRQCVFLPQAKCFVFLGVLFSLVFETESYVAQVGPKFLLQLRMVLNS